MICVVFESKRVTKIAKCCAIHELSKNDQSKHRNFTLLYKIQTTGYDGDIKIFEHAQLELLQNLAGKLTLAFQ